jgi:TolB protein
MRWNLPRKMIVLVILSCLAAVTWATDYHLWCVNSDGSGLRELSTFPSQCGHVQVFSPDGEAIAFSKDFAANASAEIWRVNADGTGLTQLTNGGPSVNNREYPRDWSVTGRIAFRSERDNHNGWFTVWTMSSNGSGQTNLGEANGCSDSYSPDGSRIAYCKWYEGQVKVMNADGSNKTVIHNCQYGSGANRLTWLACDKIVFQDGPNDNANNIYVMNPNGTGFAAVAATTGNDRINDDQYVVSGSRLVFYSNAASNYDIYSVNLNGSDLRKLTTDAVDDVEPIFSPDGSKILWVRGSEGSRSIWVMNADGSGQHEWVSGADNYSLAAGPSTGGTFHVSFLSSGTPVVHNEETTTLLPVPYYHQSNTPWCLPASVSMVLKYYGVNRKPAWVAKDLGLDTSHTDENKQRTWDAQRSGVQAYLLTYLHLSEEWWWQYDGSISRPFSECSSYVADQVKSWRRPVMFGANLDDGDGHEVVIVGVSNDSLYVNDPSGYLLRCLWDRSHHHSQPYMDWEFHPVAHGIAWCDLREFYNSRSWVATITDLAQVPADPSAASLDVLPCNNWHSYGVLFTKKNGKGLRLAWVGYLGESWYPYTYTPDPGSNFPRGDQLGYCATPDCSMRAVCHFGNSAATTRSVKVILKVVEWPSGKTVREGKKEYGLSARDWSDRDVMSTNQDEKILDPLELRGLTGTYWLSLQLQDRATSALLDTCAVFFAVAHESKDGGQEYSVVELADGYDRPHLVTNSIGRTMQLTYSIPKPADVSIVVRDVAGQAVRTFVGAAQSAGQYRLTWNGTDDGGRRLPAGTYFCSMKSGDFAATRKMVKMD